MYNTVFQVYSKVIQLFFRLYSVIGYYKILNIISCTIHKSLLIVTPVLSIVASLPFKYESTCHLQDTS